MTTEAINSYLRSLEFKVSRVKTRGMDCIEITFMDSPEIGRIIQHPHNPKRWLAQCPGGVAGFDTLEDSLSWCERSLLKTMRERLLGAGKPPSPKTVALQAERRRASMEMDEFVMAFN